MEKGLENLRRRYRTKSVLGACAVFTAFFLSACSELQRPTVEPFYAVTVPPRKQELRWSNGKQPKSLDPARAAAAPETDVVRAIYDGLTELDGKTLREIPSVAEKWEQADGGRQWTFHLRHDVRWSNGERVTAQDFVRSWKRLGELKEKAANRVLFQNIVGLKSPAAEIPADNPEPARPAHSENVPEIHRSELQQLAKSQTSAPPASEPKTKSDQATDPPKPKTTPEPPKFGVEAIDDSTLQVKLDLPDKDFAKLVANPIFRPVYGDGANFDQAKLDPATVTNGAFKIVSIGDDGISLERSETYWNKKNVVLERVKFVASPSSEAALEAYKNGDIDVLTNTAFEPLALKLLMPYSDFRQTIHSALNFYEFNTAKAPFNDRRVRTALAIAIDREKLTDSDLEGTSRPAFSFFPTGEQPTEPLIFDAEKAKLLLEKAGFPNGTDFPAIKLVVNRNDTQQRIARSIARMWKQNLNLETVISVKDSSEIEGIRNSGDFDLVRRSVVMLVNDDVANLSSILGSVKKPVEIIVSDRKPEKEQSVPGTSEPVETRDAQTGGPSAEVPEIPASKPKAAEPPAVISRADAVFDANVIPLYFPTAYMLAKPYVKGFEMNALDAPSLKEVAIDTNWQPK